MKSIKVGCALCEAPANMYCESDRASLCWRCDNKVHGANFLVAKHTRTALCHHCQAETPWTASGPRLPPSMSLCLSCAASLNNNRHCTRNDHTTQISVQSQNQNRNQTRNGHTTQISVQSRVNDDGSDNDDVESSLYEDDEEEGYSSDDVDDTENQVVPLTLSNGVTPSSIEMSGCSSEEAGEEDVNSSDLLTALPPVLLKRKREVFVSD